MLINQTHIMRQAEWIRRKQEEAKTCAHNWQPIYRNDPMGPDGCMKCLISKSGWEGHGPLQQATRGKEA